MNSENAGDVVRCPCDCKSLPEFTHEEALRAVDFLGVPEWDIGQKLTGNVFKDTLEYRRMVGELVAEGMNEEREHCDVTGGDSIQTAKIALAHLKEDPYYYERLKRAGL